MPPGLPLLDAPTVLDAVENAGEGHVLMLRENRSTDLHNIADSPESWASTLLLPCILHRVSCGHQIQ